MSVKERPDMYRGWCASESEMTGNSEKFSSEKERERLVVHGATCQYNTSFVCRETQHNSMTHRENLRETQVTSKFLESAGKL